MAVVHPRGIHAAAAAMTPLSPFRSTPRRPRTRRCGRSSAPSLLARTGDLLRAPGGGRRRRTFLMLASPVNGCAPAPAIGAAHPVGVSEPSNRPKSPTRPAFIGASAQRTGRQRRLGRERRWESVSADAASAPTCTWSTSRPRTCPLLDQVGGCGASVSKPLPTSAGRHRCRSTGRCRELSTGFADPNVRSSCGHRLPALIVWAFHPGFHVPLRWVGLLRARAGHPRDPAGGASPASAAVGRGGPLRARPQGGPTCPDRGASRCSFR